MIISYSKYLVYDEPINKREQIIETIFHASNIIKSQNRLAVEEMSIFSWISQKNMFKIR